jgi:hypothetical protein
MQIYFLFLAINVFAVKILRDYYFHRYIFAILTGTQKNQVSIPAIPICTWLYLSKKNNKYKIVENLL